MKWDFLKAESVPRPPRCARAVAIMAAVGAFTGLLSGTPSPFPELSLDDTGLLLNAGGVPLHAGIAFGAGIGLMMWLWVDRDPVKCLLAMVLTLLGWLAGVNTANDIFSIVVGSEMFGTIEGAKMSRGVVGLLLAGVGGGAIGAGLTAFGSGIPGAAIRRRKSWVLIAAVGAGAGLLLYPAIEHDALVILFVPWQAMVAAAVAYGLTRT